MQTNNRGFGLLEMLIAIVLLGMFGIAVSKMLQLSMNTQKAVASKIELDNTTILVTRLLSEPTHCLEYFGNKEFGGAPSALGDASVAGVSVFMPGKPQDIVVGEGKRIGNLTVTSAILKDFVYSTDDNYYAKLVVAIAPPRGINISRSFDISIQTETKAGTAGATTIKVITGCTGIATRAVATHSDVSTVMAVHSQTASIPDCPTDWNSLWTGYSFVTMTGGGGNATAPQDLGKPGACWREFKPLGFIECRYDVCDYYTGGDYTFWLVNSSMTVNTGGTPAATARSWVSRCRVCEAQRTVLAVHSQTTTVPGCPGPEWTQLWSGYSFLTMTGGGGAPVGTQDLSNPGSCLREFRAMPFVECNGGGAAGTCDYATGGDYAYYLTGQTINTGAIAAGVARGTLISRCVVCAK